MDALKKAIGESGPWEQTLIAWGMWVVSHINLATGLMAFLVVAYQLKTSFYKSKLARVQYDKACQDQLDGDQ